jgi:hypothetical protein
MGRLAKSLAGRDMEVGLTFHLGYEKHGRGEKTNANRRSGKTAKDLMADDYRSPSGPGSRLRAADGAEASGETKFPRSSKDVAIKSCRCTHWGLRPGGYGAA